MGVGDNVDITPGSGKTVLADYVTHPSLGTGIAQAVKILTGTPDGYYGWIVDAFGAGYVVLRDPSGTNVLDIDGSGNIGVNVQSWLAGQTVPVAQVRPSVPTVTSVSASASSVQLLALNTSRKDCTLYNDSTAACRVKLGTTASTTSFTVKLDAGGYYEVPYGYTGRIDCIWESANGSMRVTELT